MTARARVLPGDVYGRLVVRKELEPLVQPSGQRKRRFNFLCECGKTTIALLDNVKSGRTRSCGCGETENRIVHGLSDHPFYLTWRAMHKRCAGRPGYVDRGITVAPEWCGEDGLKNFIEWATQDGTRDRNVALEVDRIDNDKGYEPGNCRLATKSRNQRNRRNTLRVADGGIEVPLLDYVERHGSAVAYETVCARIFKFGWSAADAISRPSRVKNR